MELKWLEDFLSIAETRSFSRSAEARHVTQSAFSRRIRSLEVWLGADLLDRSSFPVNLTAAGSAFREAAEEMVRLAHQSRANLGANALARAGRHVSITVLHSLSATFLPAWLARMDQSLGPLDSRILPENHALCLQALVDGGHDFLLTFHHPSVPVPLPPGQYPWRRVGEDSLVLVACTQPPAGHDERLALIEYGKGSFLGLMSSLARNQAGAPATRIAHVNETSMAETMKRMVLAGLGAAWLPRSLVEAEIKAGLVEIMAPAMPMEIRLYRNVARARQIVERIWAAAE